MRRTTMLFKVGRLVNRVSRPFVDLRKPIDSFRELPRFLRSWRQYSRSSTEPMPLLDLYPQLEDRAAPAGSARGDYFHQDLWAARKIFQSAVKQHHDIGSRVDGFVAHCAVFTKVIYVDVRPLGVIRNVESRVGRFGALPFADGSIDSLSCLHVVEHVGLGRYGDPLDPQGTIRALADLRRILAPKGNLYLGLPIGKQRVCFNAHRITNPDAVIEAMRGLELVDFASIDHSGELDEHRSPAECRDLEYSCGLFHFRRP